MRLEQDQWRHGSFYRSKHELVFVFKKGKAPHINTFGLGDTGRYRTDVWDYPGFSSLGASRDEELAMHPTVKPVALIADAIKDCSRRGDIILDVFGGSGSTLIAADQCGRFARLIEIDPLYCDTIIRRFERLAGEQARFHKSDMQLITDLCKCRRLTKRDLLKIAHQEWVAVGSPKPRGWRMPSLRKTRADLERITEGCVELLQEMMAGQTMSDRDISVRLRQLQR